MPQIGSFAILPPFLILSRLNISREYGEVKICEAVRQKGTPQSLRFSASSPGSSVRRPTSRAESNRRMGPHHPFAPVTSRRELLAARLGPHRNSPIRQIRAQTVDAAYPRPRRAFQRLGVNLPLQGRRGPWKKEAEGSANEAVDMPFGITNGKFQIANLRSAI